MRPTHVTWQQQTAAAPGGAAGLQGMQGMGNNQGAAGAPGALGASAVVAITHAHYDKRGLVTRDVHALGQSLRALAYLTLASTHQVGALMLGDGGLSLLVSVLRRLLVPPARPSARGAEPGRHEAAGDGDGDGERDADRDAERDGHDEAAQAALAAAANLMLRARSRVRDALVEAGLVDVLVRFLEPLVAHIEALAALPSPPAPPPPNTNGNASSQDSMDLDQPLPLAIAPQNTDPTSPPNTANNTNDTLVQSLPPASLPHAPSAAEPVSATQQAIATQVSITNALVAAANTQTQLSHALPHNHHTHSSPLSELPYLPNVRLPIIQTPESTKLFNNVVANQHNILLACKILHVVSKYPHLRHYMHVDSVRPVRPRLVDLCGAAVAAAAATPPVIPPQPALPLDIHAPTGATAGLGINNNNNSNLDRFESSIPPLPIIALASVANPLQQLPSEQNNNNNQKQHEESQIVAPIITTIPMLVFDNEPESEISLLESLTTIPPDLKFAIPNIPPPTQLPTTPAATPPVRQHLIQTKLHFVQAPTNSRSAFELMEVFSSPCSLIPEARSLGVATLRNAYRRDPVPTPSDAPHYAMNQAMGPCLYIDADAFVKSGGRVIQRPTTWTCSKASPLGSISSTGGGIVVGLGHLRRCANSRCGKWEEGYKQFSKCSRCRRVSYCSKACQRKAWVLHKNWCLKYTGDSAGSNAGVVGVGVGGGVIGAGGIAGATTATVTAAAVAVVDAIEANISVGGTDAFDHAVAAGTVAGEAGVMEQDVFPVQQIQQQITAIPIADMILDSIPPQPQQQPQQQQQQQQQQHLDDDEDDEMLTSNSITAGGGGGANDSVMAAEDIVEEVVGVVVGGVLGQRRASSSTVQRGFVGMIDSSGDDIDTVIVADGDDDAEAQEDRRPHGIF
ncbi:hypothetical protein HK100_012268 [Physocladia obscura]|uniref:MYND-type domain-containing protein n=1 Tax=Physocladia obscura TaxID=109957 RepID=A0AAD5T0L7_9FUNG|nr:hypothetical protein HK100_012268 [Physocladia obscura]